VDVKDVLPLGEGWAEGGNARKAKKDAKRNAKKLKLKREWEYTDIKGNFSRDDIEKYIDLEDDTDEQLALKAERRWEEMERLDRENADVEDYDSKRLDLLAGISMNSFDAPGQNHTPQKRKAFEDRIKRVTGPYGPSMGKTQMAANAGSRKVGKAEGRCFAQAVNGKCNSAYCKADHTLVWPREEAVAWAETTVCKQGDKCTRKNGTCLFLHAKSQEVVVAKEAAKAEIAPAKIVRISKEKATLVGVKPEGKAEGLLGRTKSVGHFPAHDSVRMIYADMGVAGWVPANHGTFTRGGVFTTDYELMIQKRLAILGPDAIIYELLKERAEKVADHPLGAIYRFPFPRGLEHVKQMSCRVVKPGEDLFLTTTYPKEQFSSGAHAKDGEHTCPSVDGDCGAPLVTASGECVGLHTSHIATTNGFFEFTSDFLLKVGGSPKFQSAPK
jgi:hypothetical protein